MDFIQEFAQEFGSPTATLVCGGLLFVMDLLARSDAA